MRSWGLALLCVIGFAALVLAIPAEGPTAWDSAFREMLGTAALTQPGAFMYGLNGAGSVTAFAIVALAGAVWLWRMGKKREAGALLGTLLGALLLNTVLKALIARSRPEHSGWIEASGNGFPSGNAMMGMALYGFLVYLVWRSTPSIPARLASAVLGTAVIAGLGFSRLYFGVHYLTDILAGYMGGLFCIAVTAGILSRKRGLGRDLKHQRSFRGRSL